MDKRQEKILVEKVIRPLVKKALKENNNADIKQAYNRMISLKPWVKIQKINDKLKQYGTLHDFKESGKSPVELIEFFEDLNDHLVEIEYLLNTV